MPPTWASPLLLSTQQLRINRSGVITSWYGIVIATYGVVWSIFLRAYHQWENIAFGFIISSILLAFWRLYMRRIDNGIAQLYPELIDAEVALKIPPEYGTLGYLSRDVPCLIQLLGPNSDLKPKQKTKAISYLVEQRRVGQRTHSTADFISALAIILSNLWFIIKDKQDYCQPEAILIYLLVYAISGVALSSIRYAYKNGQHDPEQDDINDAKDSATGKNRVKKKEKWIPYILRKLGAW